MVHIATSILRTGNRPTYLPKWSHKKQDNHQDINQDINHQDQDFNNQGARGGTKRKCVTLLDSNDHSNSNSNKRIALRSNLTKKFQDDM